MISTARTTAPARSLVVLLGALTAFASLSTDMYLPSLPSIGWEFNVSTAATQGNRIWNFVAFGYDSDSEEGCIDGGGSGAWTGFGIAFPRLKIRALATRNVMIYTNFC